MRVAFVGIQTTELLTFRREMLREMAAAGHEVLALAPERDAAVETELAAMGVAFEAVHLHRAGMNPVRDAWTMLSLARQLRRFRADAILVTAAKPVIYGTLAARLARVPMRAAMITGIGSALSGGTGTRRRVLATVVRLLYRTGLHRAHVVFFQNGDDEALFVDLGLVGRHQRRVRIAGSGIDLQAFRSQPLPDGPVTFLMVARLLRDKGLYELVEAARRVRAVHPDVRIRLLGPLDPNPEGITASDVDAIVAQGDVDYLGATEDVRPYLAAATVVVLPSYREGTPRSLLEAMAMGRPILTTDVPGCRETIESGHNGLLVPARDAGALAEAMLAMVETPAMLAQMGTAGRALVEARFDVHDVNRTILGAMGLAPATAPRSPGAAPGGEPGPAS